MTDMYTAGAACPPINIQIYIAESQIDLASLRSLTLAAQQL